MTIDKESIIDEIRAISSDAIAKQQSNAKNKYPDLIKKIKGKAAFGVTSCEFGTWEVDEYSKKLLEADGFRVYSTSKTHPDYKHEFSGQRETVWIISW